MRWVRIQLPRPSRRQSFLGWLIGSIFTALAVVIAAVLAIAILPFALIGGWLLRRKLRRDTEALRDHIEEQMSGWNDQAPDAESPRPRKHVDVKVHPKDDQTTQRQD
jgi:hypothetical protein